MFADVDYVFVSFDLFINRINFIFIFFLYYNFLSTYLYLEEGA